MAAMTHAQPQVSDRSVKAAFLLRFADFVTWPEQAAHSGPFTVCLTPSHNFGTAVEAVAKGATVRGRPVEVREIHGADAVAKCEILYIAPADEHFLPATRRRPVLTVGEGQRFCERGGVINLRLVDERVRFEISLTHARAVGLSVDPQLLRLALTVHGGRE